MKQLQKKQGFSIIEVVIVIVIVGLVAALGYVAWNSFSNQSANTPTSSEEKTVAEDVPTAPEINDTSDLDEANATLDSVDVGGSDDSATLEKEYENF